MLPGRSADRSTPTRVVSSRTGVFVGVALLAANIANYAFQVVTGRALSVADYGSLAGYMAAVTVITVSTSSLQTMAARTVAAGENDPTRRGLLDGLTRSALVWTGVVALIVVGLAPLLGRLSTFGWVVTVLLGIYVVPAAIDSIASGRLQGARRFPALAAYTTAQATGKLLVVVVALALGASVVVLLVAIIASSATVAIIGRMSSRRTGAIDAHVLGAESRRAFLAVTIFWVMISIDVPIAHARFDGRAAGVYAAGAVLGKAVLWIPVTVSQLVFPTLAGTSDRDVSTAVFKRAAILVTIVATASVLGLAMLGGPLYQLLYGDRYDGASTVAWKIGLAMLPMAMLNLTMFHRLARRDGTFLVAFAAGATGLIAALLTITPEATSFAAAMGIAGIAVLVTTLAMGARRPGAPSIAAHEVARR